jgi:hypothetical protein
LVRATPETGGKKWARLIAMRDNISKLGQDIAVEMRLNMAGREKEPRLSATRS